MIQDGQIHDGKTIATLLMYDRFFRQSEGQEKAQAGGSGGGGNM